MATKLIQLIEGVVTNLNTTVEQLAGLKDTVSIDDTGGVWLDYIALIVGCPPRTRNIDGSSPISDIEYRKRLKALININNGGATTENIANAVRFYVMMDDDNDWDSVKNNLVDITYNNATVTISVSGVTPVFAGEINKLTPIGVGLWILYIPEDPFVTAGGTGLGLGTTTDLNAGGNLAYFI